MMMMMVGRRRYVGIDAVVRRREEHLEQDLHGEPDFPVFAVGVDRGAVDDRQQDELCAPEHPVPRQKDPREQHEPEVPAQCLGVAEDEQHPQPAEAVEALAKRRGAAATHVHLAEIARDLLSRLMHTPPQS